MKRVVSLVTVVAIIGFVSCNGSNSKQGDEKEIKKEKVEEKKKSDIELVNYENSVMGFTILVPKKAKVLADSEYGFTTSQVLPDNMSEVNVSVNTVSGEINSVDAFKKDLENFMAKNITKAEKTESGFLAVNEQFTVKVFHRTDKLQVTVSVPKELQDLAEKIALSIKSTK